MASLCKRQQCTIERRGFRQELDSWRHKLIHCVGKPSCPCCVVCVWVRAHACVCAVPAGLRGSSGPDSSPSPSSRVAVEALLLPPLRTRPAAEEAAAPGCHSCLPPLLPIPMAAVASSPHRTHPLKYMSVEIYVYVLYKCACVRLWSWCARAPPIAGVSPALVGFATGLAVGVFSILSKLFLL